MRVGVPHELGRYERRVVPLDSGAGENGPHPLPSTPSHDCLSTSPERTSP